MVNHLALKQEARDIALYFALFTRNGTIAQLCNLHDKHNFAFFPSVMLMTNLHELDMRN